MSWQPIVEIERTFWRITQQSQRTETGYTAQKEERVLVPNDRADLVSSQTQMEKWHLPAIDFDFPAKLIPSKTEGHFHLFLEQPVKWKKYKKVLKAMAEAGLINPGYYTMSVKRKQSFLRINPGTPGVPEPAAKQAVTRLSPVNPSFS